MLYTHDSYTPLNALVTEVIHEHDEIYTLRLELTDKEVAEKYNFAPGQFNMLYLYGVGEVAISIVNDRLYKPGAFEHTIQAVGRITNTLQKIKPGASIGIRGPFGTAWPNEVAKGKDIIIATGGLGNAPLVAQVNEILNNRKDYGKLRVLHGIRSNDWLIYQDWYKAWHQAPNTKVMMVTSNADPIDNGLWDWGKGFITEYIHTLDVDFANTVVMSVGPEIMMKNVAEVCVKAGISPEHVFLSLERSMKCGVGHCGHCQVGADFVCKDGPVYPYSRCRNFLTEEGL